MKNINIHLSHSWLQTTLKGILAWSLIWAPVSGFSAEGDENSNGKTLNQVSLIGQGQNQTSVINLDSIKEVSALTLSQIELTRSLETYLRNNGVDIERVESRSLGITELRVNTRSQEEALEVKVIHSKKDGFHLPEALDIEGHRIDLSQHFDALKDLIIARGDIENIDLDQRERIIVEHVSNAFESIIQGVRKSYLNKYFYTENKLESLTVNTEDFKIDYDRANATTKQRLKLAAKSVVIGTALGAFAYSTLIHDVVAAGSMYTTVLPSLFTAGIVSIIRYTAGNIEINKRFRNALTHHLIGSLNYQPNELDTTFLEEKLDQLNKKDRSNRIQLQNIEEILSLIDNKEHRRQLINDINQQANMVKLFLAPLYLEAGNDRTIQFKENFNHLGLLSSIEIEMSRNGTPKKYTIEFMHSLGPDALPKLHSVIVKDRVSGETLSKEYTQERFSQLTNAFRSERSSLSHFIGRMLQEPAIDQLIKNQNNMASKEYLESVLRTLRETIHQYMAEVPQDTRIFHEAGQMVEKIVQPIYDGWNADVKSTIQRKSTFIRNLHYVVLIGIYGTVLETGNRLFSLIGNEVTDIATYARILLELTALLGLFAFSIHRLETFNTATSSKIDLKVFKMREQYQRLRDMFSYRNSKLCKSLFF
ncbi:MAG: hypothetical protein CL677_03535 [Bdellovibrionaceae bacterium]|nr:hypothetical protein [Pseudobdellovibrionaceae bacterium]